MGAFIDLTNQIYGKLTVIEIDHKDPKNGYYWKCLCSCGNKRIIIVSGRNLKLSTNLSCGCLNDENKKNILNDLIGKKFNQLTVFGFEQNKGKKIIWLCRCNCGNSKIVRVTESALKRNTTKSCGCFRRKRLEYGESCFNDLYGTYIRNSRKRNFLFELSKEEFKILTKKNCFYCGTEPKQIYTKKLAYGEYIYNGVDRISSLLGYTVENCVTCCWRCNQAKNDEKQNDFFEWIKLVYNNLFNKER